MKNVPNILSAIRILLVPFFVFFYMAEFIPCGKLIALIIFIVASLTDMLDGKIARKYNLVSDLGKLLDPIADKVLVLSALLMVTFDGLIPAPFGMLALLIIITRDYVVDALRQISANKGIVISADIWGKMKTIVTMVALIVLILFAYLNSAFSIDSKVMYIIWVIAVTIFAIAVVLTLLSGANYLIKNRTLFKNANEKIVVENSASGKQKADINEDKEIKDEKNN